MPTLSVLMPVLNEAASVEYAIDSVLAQTGADLQVLVADGSSADATKAIVARRAAADDRIVALDNPKVTIPAALNVCLHHSSGDYVARIDGHSTINAGYFAAALSWLAEDSRLAGVGGHRMGVAETPVGRAIALVLASKFGVGNSIYHYATTAQLTDHATFGVYRADAVRQVGGWDEDLPVNEDVDFDHRLIEAGWKLGYQPAMVVRWKVRETVRDLFGQYRRYGRGKAQMVRKNGRTAVRLRHLAPPLAVAAGGAVLVASLAQPWALVLLTPYAALVLTASVLAYRDRTAEPTSAVALPAAFAATHVGWGLGFIEGLLGRSPALASGNAQLRPASRVADGLS